MKQKKITSIASLIWTGKYLILSYVILVVSIPILLQNLQRLYFCSNLSNCYIAGFYTSFLLINLILGPFIIGYSYALSTKKRISRFLVICGIIFCSLYFIGLYLGFYSYIKISNNSVEVHDKIYSQTSKQIPINDIRAVQFSKSYIYSRYAVNHCQTNIKLITNTESIDITNFGYGYSEILVDLRKYRSIPVEYTTTTQACPDNN